MYKLYPFQQEFVDRLLKGERFHIPVGYGKIYILMEYARKVAPAKVIIFTTMPLATSYKQIIDKAGITNITILTT